MSILTNTFNLFNLFKGPTYFKTPKGRSIDLMLTNKKQSFIKSQFFESGFCDLHLTYTILRSNFVKLPLKIIRYHKYKKFRVEDFQTYLDNSLRTNNHLNYQVFHSVTETVLQKHAPWNKRGNNKPHIKSNLRKAIMIRTRLKNMAKLDS